MSQAVLCLERLGEVNRVNGVEVIVVSALGDAGLADAEYPTRVVSVEPGGSWPEMRAAGIRVANGARVAVLSEDYLVKTDWLEAVVSGGDSADVLVGEVVHSSSSLFSFAAYLWEYLHVAAPARAGRLGRGDAVWVPAGAVIYRREALDVDQIERADSEIVYHQQMFDAGVAFWRDPQVAVLYEPPRSNVLLVDRVEWSRLLASSRARSMGVVQRGIQAVSRLVLPLVLLMRFLAKLAVRPRYWVMGAVVSPYAVVFSLAEMWGEVQGYVGARR